MERGSNVRGVRSGKRCVQWGGVNGPSTSNAKHIRTFEGVSNEGGDKEGQCGMLGAGGTCKRLPWARDTRVKESSQKMVVATSRLAVLKKKKKRYTTDSHHIKTKKSEENVQTPRGRTVGASMSSSAAAAAAACFAVSSRTASDKAGQASAEALLSRAMQHDWCRWRMQRERQGAAKKIDADFLLVQAAPLPPPPQSASPLCRDSRGLKLLHSLPLHPSPPPLLSRIPS